MKQILRQSKTYILFSVAVFSLAVTYIDAFVHPPYFSKIPIKILFFLALPLLYFLIHKDEGAALRRLFRFEKKGFLLSLLLGAVLYAFIIGAFLLTRNLIDFSGVTDSLTSGMEITPKNFPLVAVYISVANSFLEEFFFRAFGFLTLKPHVPPVLAWFFSPFFFACYHVGMTVGMFHPAVILLLMTGLIIGGLIFNGLSFYFGSIYPSWFVHMAADLAIMTVGAILFGLI